MTRSEMSDLVPDGAPADRVIFADHMMTMGPHEVTGKGFVAVRDGRIAGVGPREHSEAFIGDDTTVHEMGAGCILPGFIDVHAHMEVACRTQYEAVDCRAPTCATVDDVLDQLSSHLADSRDGWLVAQGNLFFDRKLRDRRFPTREELDRVSRTTAIVIRAGGHLSILNSKALELADIGRHYVAPEETVTGTPVVLTDGAGEPTGVVKEMDNLLPFPRIEESQLPGALRDGANELFARYGVTTVGEISETTTGLDAMEAMHRRGTFPVRVNAYLWSPGTLDLQRACSPEDVFSWTVDRGLIRIQGVKLFADGGYSAANAAVHAEYVIEPGSRGHLSLSAQQITEAVEMTWANGLQLAVHANGERAQEEVCAGIVSAGLRPDQLLRPRLEHAGNLLPNPTRTTAAWRDADIIPVPQPVFLYGFGDFYPDYLGDYGRRGRSPFRSLLADGWELTGSSDVWIGSEPQQTNPMFSVWCAVTRRSFMDDIIDPDEAVDVATALEMHTINGARVLGVDHERGSLEVGKAADVVVLDRDPRSAPSEALPKLRAQVVLMNGVVTHRTG